MLNLSDYFSRFSFHPVIELQPGYEVYDFTKGYDANRMRTAVNGVGRYHEKRAGMYTTELFTRSEIRDIHLGIDIAAPAGEAVHAFYAGRIFCAAINDAAGDYGGTIITEHVLFKTSEKPGESDPLKFWVLHGHLSHASVDHAQALAVTGTADAPQFQAGDVLGWLGEETENGGWNPHLHFQISLVEPAVCDMPGAASDAKLESELQKYPDPQLILGKLY